MIKTIFFVGALVVFILSANESSAAWCHAFNANLGIGSQGSDVLDLKTALMKNGVWPQEAVSNEFDEKTALAVVNFQEKYRSEILTPVRLKRGNGYVGKLTRAKLNNLYDCKITTPIAPTPVTPPPVKFPVISTPVISAPVITAISPFEGRQGTDIFTMAIKGYNFSGARSDLNSCGISPVDSYGFKFISCQVLSDSNIEAKFSITAVARIGEQYITVETPKGGRSIAAAFSVLPSKAALSISLVSPNGREQWLASSTQTITWQSTGLDETKPVNLTLGPSNVWQAENIPNTGVYSFTVPSDVPSGDKYQIYISAAGVRDQSDNYFNITAATTTPIMPVPVLPSIKILSPGKGEIIKAGSKHTVRWDSTNLTSGNIILYQHFEGKDPFWQYLATISTGAASYEWKVPNNIGKAGIWVGNWINESWLAKNTVDDFTIMP